MLRSLVGSEMCIRDSINAEYGIRHIRSMPRKTGAAVWNVVEAYPLFAAIGGGLGLCAVHLARFSFKSPDVHINKNNRSNPMLENFSEGKRWKGLGVRNLAENGGANKYF
eukprot:TRINITY_DN790_c0_g1_i17.p1 TRINITY_DN790_c0_g1~~TRINITY_DN790_c0_g1_i17.p1  ORF type:complete len:110 (+),score=33.94 TRINITY_DN790_c0_g1_i17:90-419(+)